MPPPEPPGGRKALPYVGVSPRACEALRYARLVSVPAPSTLLKELETLRLDYGRGAGERRLELLDSLDGTSLRTAAQVRRLHELLCFLHAYPDNRAVLLRVESMLDGFAAREDLGAFRDELADSGIAGSDVYYRFYWVTARWLARHWPDRLTITWQEFDNADSLVELLDLLLPYSETVALDMVARSPREWLEALKREDETDAAFLIRRFETFDASPAVRERIYERLDVPMRIAGGADTPSRSRAKHPVPRVLFQTRPLDSKRPDLRALVPRLRPQVRPVWLQEARALIDRAREAMVTRSRDLDGFAQADENDIRMVRYTGGLEFAMMGAQPEHRLLLEARYTILMLKNGVPIGYALVNSLFGSSEIAYNVFDTFRGCETAQIFARVLAVGRRLFGADTYSIDPYQLGHGNAEGLRSGAWWFYYKLGFRPHDPEVKALVREELAKSRADRRHRSSLQTLDKLSSEYMFLDPRGRRPRRDVIGRVGLGGVGTRISDYLAERFGADREKGIRLCSREAMKRLGLEALKGFSADERQAWERWSPLVRILPGLEEWSATEKRALAAVVRAKGGRRESDFVTRFDRHTRLRAAVLELAAP